MLINTKLRNELKRVISTNSEVDDVLIYGSVIRGKKNPNDFDVLVIFYKKVVKTIEYKIRKIFEKDYQNVSILSKTKQTILDPSFDVRESILFEGKSVLSEQTLGEKYGFTSYGSFKYDLKGWNNVKRTRFYYAFNGRNKEKGMSDKLGCIKFSDRVILVPLQNIEPFRDFLDSWELDYLYVPLLLPARFKKKHLVM